MDSLTSARTAGLPSACGSDRLQRSGVTWIPALVLSKLVVAVSYWVVSPAVVAAEPASRALAEIGQFVQMHCLDCHGGTSAEAGLDLTEFERFGDQGEAVQLDSRRWELIQRRLASRQMPPPDAERPSEAEYERLLERLEGVLDAEAKAHPQPGRPDAIRRLTRTEYQNAIRDLLAVEIDASALLPADESSHGFDNITVGELSPTLLNRYLSAAQHISRLAIGSGERSPAGVTIRVPADRTQEQHFEGLPFGTRGGTHFHHHFQQTGLYEFSVRLTRDRDEMVEGLHRPHHIDVRVDREQVHRFTVKPPPDGRDYTHVDTHLNARVPVSAGPHEVVVTFPETSRSLAEIKRQPFDARYNRHRHPRLTPALFQVSVVGPFDPRGAGSTPSREKILVCSPKNSDDEEVCAKEILGRLMHRAYRRRLVEADYESPLFFFHAGRDESGFESGIEAGLTSILVSPHFLFRVEQQPSEVSSGNPYRISDIELASRLSFFLWSSIPDDRLFELAEANRLHEPDVLRQEVERMLADEKSSSLVDNFAAQWLYLRNLDSVSPDLRLFPDWDDNLRQAFRRETELLLEKVFQQNESVLRLIDPQVVYVNERLALHYGIPNVQGSHFRAVEPTDEQRRGGILRQGSVLTVTSYATRTSPTIRGNWILENILGTPPPPPPPNVPNLKEKSTLAVTTVRERLAEHRANPACAACHNLMDPVGFALENYDALGRWREFEDTLPVDSSGSLPDGTQLDGIADLEAGILRRPEMFVRTLSEKLLTFALGRGIEHYDGPAVRRIVRQAAEDDYRFVSLIYAIVSSQPFQMRTAL